MADCDNGYTRIANELLDAAIKADLTKNQYKVLLAVIRKTYGYNKPMDWIGNKQLAEATGLPETRCSSIKNQLLHRSILLSKGRLVGPNKRLDEWEGPFEEKVSTPSKTFTKPVKETFTETVNDPLPKQENTKDTSPKDKKDNDLRRAEARRRNAEFADQAKQVIEHLNSTCSRQYPTTGSSNTVKGVVARLKAGATVEQLKAVIDHKQWEWGGDAKMSQYLQPSTLFKVSKVEENIANAAAWLASGKAGGHSTSGQVAAPAARDVMTDQQAMDYLRAGGLYRDLSLAVKGRIEAAFKARKLPGWMVSILDEQEAFHD